MIEYYPQWRLDILERTLTLNWGIQFVAMPFNPRGPLGIGMTYDNLRVESLRHVPGKPDASNGMSMRGRAHNYNKPLESMNAASRIFTNLSQCCRLYGHSPPLFIATGSRRFWMVVVVVIRAVVEKGKRRPA